MVDVLPELPGYRELWGKSIFQCPYCHGWEVRERPWGVLATSELMLEFSVFLTGWNKDVVAFTDGAFPVPAELRANGGVRLAWRDHPRAFRAGVYRAGIVTLALPVVLGVVPLVAFVADIMTAMAHAALGLAGAILFLEALTFGYDKAPFTCNYVPANSKGMLPIFVMAFVIGANLFARLELSMLRGSNTMAGALLLLVLFGGLRVASIKRRDPQIDFNEGPETFSQLGLHN